MQVLASARLGAGYKDLLTVKGHVVEEHVPEFVGLFGTCGILGEDGVEGLHPQDTLVRRIVRCVRNPEARHRAHTRHLERSHGLLHWSYEEGGESAHFQEAHFQEAAPRCRCRCSWRTLS